MTLPIADRPVVYVLHDNPEWIPPFTRAFERAEVPLVEWLLEGGSVDLASEPPQGVFWSRLSASSPARGRGRAKEYARSILAWLESAGRRVVGGSRVAEFEVSKVRQYATLRAAGFDVPRTVAALGLDEASTWARRIGVPFITKHNQGGKGLGVQRFDSAEQFDAAAKAGDLGESADGIVLLQEYVRAAEPFITRAEFVGGRFHYAVRVDTSAGSFQLCPADACAVPVDGQGLAPAACDVPQVVGGAAGAEAGSPAFAPRLDITAEDPLIRSLERFLAGAGIEIAGVEFIETADGRRVVYDINTNTNYNSAVESAVDEPAADAVADFLGAELAALGPGAARRQHARAARP